MSKNNKQTNGIKKETIALIMLKCNDVWNFHYLDSFKKYIGWILTTETYNQITFFTVL